MLTATCPVPNVTCVWVQGVREGAQAGGRAAFRGAPRWQLGPSAGAPAPVLQAPIELTST